MNRVFLWVSAFAVALTPVIPASAAEIQTDVCIVGGGSGGTAAAIAAVREGVQVVLVEKQAVLGGTSTAGLVCLWGAAPSESIAREIYDDMAAQGKAGVAKRLGNVPYHCWTIDPALRYESTLNAQTNRISFDPDAFSETALRILREHGVKVMLETTFEAAETDAHRVTSISVRRKDGAVDRIRAKVFIDATGDVYLCRSAGCETVIGNSLNGVTLCYRVTKEGEESPDVLAAEPLQKTSCNHQLPNGDRIINMLPTMTGDEFLELGYDAAMEKCQKLVRRHWAWLRKGPGEWGQYHFAETATLLGIREGYRIGAEYTLTAQDLQAGIEEQSHSDMIALASHAVDVHGRKDAVKRVKVKPYGIPYRCLIPKGWENILVPCRGAGFDRVTASSARLSRTMMWLGHAAGVAAAMAVSENVPVGDINTERLVAKVGIGAFAAESATEKAAEADSRPPIWGDRRHPFYCTDNGQGKILGFDADGRNVWEYPAPRCQDVWLLENGNILFSYFTESGGGVKEVTPDKHVVWEYKTKGAVHNCQRLSNGNTALGECGACRVLVVSPEGRIVQETPLLSKQKNPHYHMRHIRVAEDGYIFVCHPKEALVRKYAPDGTIVQEIRNVGHPFTAVPLPNGNLLVAGGDDCIVTEVDTKGDIVWQLTADDVPQINYKWAAGVQRLPNGNTIVCNWLGHGQYGKGIPLFEVNPAKKVVWMFTDNQTTRSISSVCVKTVPRPIR